MNDLILNFTTNLIVEKNMSVNTANSYRNDLIIFSKFLKPHDVRLSEVDNIFINLFFKDQKKKAFSDSTVSRRLSTLRQFYKFLINEGKILKSPCEKIKNFRKRTILPKVLSMSEINKLLDSAVKVGKNHLERSKNKVFLEILYGSGLRVSELVSLKKSLFFGNPDIILIKGKGGKERIVPISREAKRALKHYLKLLTKIKSGIYESDFLFPSKSKNGFLNRERLFLIIKEIALIAGLNPKSVSPHKIRHAFASHLLENGADLRVIQTLLGHKNLTTTEIYTHILDKNLREMVQKKHPFAKHEVNNF